MQRIKKTKRESKKINDKIEELKCLFISGEKTLDECAKEWSEFTLEIVADCLKESIDNSNSNCSKCEIVIDKRGGLWIKN